MLIHLKLPFMCIQIMAETISIVCRTRSLTVTLASIEGNVSKSTSVFIPTTAKVNTAIKPVLNEKPT